MENTGQSYSSGEWLVRSGSEEEFIQRWTTFIASGHWITQKGLSPSCWLGAPKKSQEVSLFGAWESQEAQQAWREMPRMQELLSRSRELCEEFETHAYTLAASPGR
jgi:heme-degrading monooxygenase HmoA